MDARWACVHDERNRLIRPSQGTRQMHRDPATQDDPCYSMCTRLVSAKKFANVSVKHLINAFEMWIYEINLFFTFYSRDYLCMRSPSALLCMGPIMLLKWQWAEPCPPTHHSTKIVSKTHTGPFLTMLRKYESILIIFGIRHPEKLDTGWGRFLTQIAVRSNGKRFSRHCTRQKITPKARMFIGSL